MSSLGTSTGPAAPAWGAPNPGRPPLRSWLPLVERRQVIHLSLHSGEQDSDVWDESYVVRLRRHPGGRADGSSSGARVRTTCCCSTGAACKHTSGGRDDPDGRCRWREVLPLVLELSGIEHRAPTYTLAHGPVCRCPVLCRVPGLLHLEARLQVVSRRFIAHCVPVLTSNQPVATKRATARVCRA